MKTPKEEGYKYLYSDNIGNHVFLNTHTNTKEVFFANKYHASWGLRWKNTHLEFAHTL